MKIFATATRKYAYLKTLRFCSIIIIIANSKILLCGPTLAHVIFFSSADSVSASARRKVKDGYSLVPMLFNVSHTNIQGYM